MLDATYIHVINPENAWSVSVLLILQRIFTGTDAFQFNHQHQFILLSHDARKSTKNKKLKRKRKKNGKLKFSLIYNVLKYCRYVLKCIIDERVHCQMYLNAILPIMRRLAFFMLDVPLLCANAINHEFSPINVTDGPTSRKSFYSHSKICIGNNCK